MICNIFNSRKIQPAIAFALLLLFCACECGYSQEQPPRPIGVMATQALTFGAFFQGVNGGTLTITPDGSRSVTGDIIQANLGIPFAPAIFEIDANAGTIITILNGPNIQLTGSNGGSMSMHVGAASINSITITSSFTTTAVPPSKTEVKVGGTLTAGTAFQNPAGLYSGTFSIIFMQQ
jgi:hypothetical protein